MPTNSAALRDLTRESLGEATASLLAGRRSPLAWARQMEATIARGHTAATIAGIADRTGITPRGLSQVERRALTAAIAEQQRYLRGFVRDLPNLSPGQIAARAQLYAGAVRATYSRFRWSGVDLPAHPADGNTACLVSCGCSWVLRDDGYYWELGTAEHCSDCLTNAARWSPYKP